VITLLKHGRKEDNTGLGWASGKCGVSHRLLAQAKLGQSDVTTVARTGEILELHKTLAHRTGPRERFTHQSMPDLCAASGLFSGHSFNSMNAIPGRIR
jgi:hypothetical protein